MAEIGIPYLLAGPDGTRAVFNDPADVDFVGYLDGENGITGLLDGATVRESTVDKVEADGAVHGLFWRGRRVGTLQGILRPDAAIDVILSAEARLKLASRGLRADCQLRYTPTGATHERMLLLRRTATPSITGRRPKQFQIALASAEHRILSSEEELVTIAAGATGEASNEGDEWAPWRAQLTGPLTNPSIVNVDLSGQQVALDITLGGGDTLDIDQARRTIVMTSGGITSDAYSAFDFATSTWFDLAPASSSTIRLDADAGAGDMSFMYRHAWE
jgi:Siphovirus-type tail component, C-terminal domain